MLTFIVRCFFLIHLNAVLKQKYYTNVKTLEIYLPLDYLYISLLILGILLNITFKDSEPHLYTFCLLDLYFLNSLIIKSTQITVLSKLVPHKKFHSFSYILLVFINDTFINFILYFLIKAYGICQMFLKKRLIQLLAIRHIATLLHL